MLLLGGLLFLPLLLSADPQGELSEQVKGLILEKLDLETPPEARLSEEQRRRFLQRHAVGEDEEHAVTLKVLKGRHTNGE